MATTNEALRLICGDPRKKPASFTRFVLPFGYRLQELRGEKKTRAIHQLHYREDDRLHSPHRESLLSRKRYFTHETGNVLFNRAKWLEVNNDQHEETETKDYGNGPTCWQDTAWAKGITMQCRNRNIVVCFLPPRMILFEWPESVRKQSGLLQTGFLLLDMFFPDEKNNPAIPTLDDLLLINDRYRFFNCPFKEHKEKLEELRLSVPDPFAHYNEKADKNDESTDINKLYYDRWLKLLTLPVIINNETFCLVPDNFVEDSRKILAGDEAKNIASDYLIYADDRTYVWSAAIIRDGGEALKDTFRTAEGRAHEFGHWVKFLNIDEPGDLRPSIVHHAISQFEKNWTQKRTYHRWEHFGTWYGFSYHSGVMLASDKDQKNIPQPYVKHFRRMYFDIVILLFYLRITLFRFSRRLSDIAGKRLDHEKTILHFSNLREKFSRFTILYQFPLLSNQQQAIEMYDLARKYFGINDFYREIQSEIANTHEYLELVKSSKLGQNANLIAKLGIPVAVMSLVAGFFGMEDFGIVKYWQNVGQHGVSWWFFAQISITGVIGFLAYYLVWGIIKRLER